MCKAIGGIIYFYNTIRG
ncbi:hypothetical protein FCV87_17165 [Vibrio breoganii]|nr:hypothetical protein FCV87_17165 [Vibrio breoganii]